MRHLPNWRTSISSGCRATARDFQEFAGIGVKAAKARLKTFAQSNMIFDRGQLVDRWEFDTATGSIAWVSFAAKDRALEDAVRKTETFIREDLGDARGFSLDSPKSRAPRIAAILKAGA